MRNCFNIRATTIEGINSIRVGIKGWWFVNYESISWSHEAKKFYELFFPKYDNFEIIGAGHIGLLTCLGWKEWDWLMKEKNYAALWIWKKDRQQKYAVAYENYDGKT